MYKIKIIIPICIFSILLGFTSAIKNKTRIVEKKIYKIDMKIGILEKDLYETELDYYYLSSPSKLSKKVKDLALVDYVPMDFSKIYLDYRDFIASQKKITNLKIKNEKKKKK